jgi:hypothetical protein
MPSRVLASAVLPAIALPVLAFGHGPAFPGFGISRAVRLVTSAVSSVAPPASSTARHAARHPAAIRYVAIDCQSAPVVRPQTFLLACADDGDRLSKLHWTSWGAGYADATGIQTMNDCAPSCAEGKFRSYPVRVILWGSAPVSGHSAERRYQMITLLYTGHQPSVGGGSTEMAGPLSVTGNLWS